MKVPMHPATIAGLKSNTPDALAPLGLGDLGHSKQLDLIARLCGYKTFGHMINDPNSNLIAPHSLYSELYVLDAKGKPVEPSAGEIDAYIQHVREQGYARIPPRNDGKKYTNLDCIELWLACKALDGSPLPVDIETRYDLADEAGVAHLAHGEAIWVEWADAPQQAVYRNNSYFEAVLVPETGIALLISYWNDDGEEIANSPSWMSISGALRKMRNDTGGRRDHHGFYHSPGTKEHKDQLKKLAIENYLARKWLTMYPSDSL